MGNEKTLLLNSDYRIIKTVRWQTAMKLFYSNKVAIVEEYDRYISHPTANVKVPAVIALLSYKPVHKHMKPKFSSETLYARDNYTCAYCGHEICKTKLTKDHVVPRAHFRAGKATGKETSWVNIVTACRQCNNKKGPRTPEEANMPLKYQPVEPKERFLFTYKKDIPKEWISYIN